MSFIIFCLFLTIGFFVGSYGIIQALIIIFFGIPFTNELLKNNIISSAFSIKRRYCISLIVLSLATLFVTVIIYYFFKSSIMPYFYGLGIVLLIGFNQIGKNQNNLESYFLNNVDSIDLDKFKELYIHNK